MCGMGLQGAGRLRKREGRFNGALLRLMQSQIVKRYFAIRRALCIVGHVEKIQRDVTQQPHLHTLT